MSCVVACAAAAPATADTFKPTRFDDPPPGKCKPANCSLREAIKAANNHNGQDHVVLGDGTYELELPATDGAPNADGQLVSFGELTLSGLGPAKSKIDANGVDRVLAVLGEKSRVTAVTLKGGDANANPFHSDEGGALLTIADGLVLGNVTIRQNHAEFGGGVRAAGDSLTIKNSTITDNDAVFGGAIESTGQKLTVKRSTLNLNRAVEGGGLDLRPAPVLPETRLVASTISNNLAAHKGGGILADGNPASGSDQPGEPSLLLLNSTVVENTAVDLESDIGTREGGGIMADNEAGVTLDNTTVYANRAGDVIEEGVGGGIYQHSGAVFNWGDSLLAGNSVGHMGTVSSSHPGAECAGTFTSVGGDLMVFQDGALCSPGADVTGTNNAGIGTFDFHGGPTATVSLASGSVALGLATGCPKKDQRGKPRPPTGCDTGSFEREGP